MTHEQLAIHGGRKTILSQPQKYNTIGSEEKEAVISVLESGCLSDFLGCWSPQFYGGPNVQLFEKACEQFFGVKHAITVNSWTSGLIAAVGAVGIAPGDEIIVTPWTMCASATAILHWNALPVFADISPNDYCIDPESVLKNITPYTKAIMSVDIFGCSANMNALRQIADKYDLKIISDSAQAPGATYSNSFAGTLADIGGISLNYHKHIHTGEGGVLFTNSDDYADRLRLIRNHGEAVVKDKRPGNISNILGFNFRLGEIEAAIGLQQLHKLPSLLSRRQEIAKALADGLRDLEGLILPVVPSNSTHAYYVFPMRLDKDQVKVSRDDIIKALHAEGLTELAGGYENLHLLPIFQEKIAYGNHGFPWNNSICKRDINYSKGICPNAEDLHDNTFLAIPLCLYDYSDHDVQCIISAFRKVWTQLDTILIL